MAEGPEGEEEQVEAINYEVSNIANIPTTIYQVFDEAMIMYGTLHFKLLIKDDLDEEVEEIYTTDLDITQLTLEPDPNEEPGE